MAFETGLDINDVIGYLSSTDYRNFLPTVHIDSVVLDDVAAYFSSGSYVSSAAKVFTEAVNLGNLFDGEFGIPYVVSDPVKISTGSAVVFFSTRPTITDDDAVDIVFGRFFEVDFKMTPAFGEAPLGVVFKNLGFVTFDYGEDDTITYSWNFGDRTTSALENPIHTYRYPGIYTVTLTTHVDNDQKSVSKPIVVYVSGMNTHRTNKSYTLGIVNDLLEDSEAENYDNDEQGV